MTLWAQAQEAEEQETVKVSGSSPYMKIRVFDPGSSREAYGDAALLESGGEYLLIDTGAREPSNLVVHILKKKGIRKLSLYISHYHEDHCDYAASIIRDSYFKVKKVYLANPDPVKRYVTSYYKTHRRKLYNSCRDCYDRYKDIVSAAKKKGTRIIELRKGDTFHVGDVRAKVLWDHNKRGVSSFDPYDVYGLGYVNNSSLVTKFTLGERSFLTGGDIECSTERDLLASGVNLTADIFKLNHHGIWSANTAAFVRAVNPCYIYYSYKNQADQERSKFGSAPDVAPILRKLSRTYNILGNRYNGTIVYLVQDNMISVAADRHFWEKKIRVRYTESGRITTQTLVYNDAQKLYLDKRMLIPGTTLVSGTAADPDAQFTGWKKTSAGWKYKTKNGTWLRGGWHKVGGAVYYFTVKGIRHEGWLVIKGKTYFLSRIGVRQTGWQMIDGKVYYFDKEGVMAKGRTRIGKEVWPLRKDGSLDLSKKNAPPASVLTVEHRHTTR
ncbi:MAG: hypothetical protein Q4D81_07070 [Eubacteriales bacterium]|nr:hypothetical protein [Eubacteriales bacterium]